MKKYLLIILVAVSVKVSFAQTGFRFADSTAQWNVLSVQWCMTMPCASFQTIPYEVKGDTVISQLSYQVISLPGISSLKCFVRKDSLQKVYGFSNTDSVEHLLYDFSLQINDTAELGNAMGVTWPVQQVVCRVDSIDSVQLDKLRKRVYVVYKYPEIGDFWVGSDVWIEGMGSINMHFLSPGVDPQMLDGPTEQLLCFFEKDTLLYHHYISSQFTNDTTSCFLDFMWTGIRELLQGGLVVSPNPATSFITIQSENNLLPQTTFQLFDITGRMGLQKQLTGATNRIELNDVSKGMYLYQVVSSSQKLGAGKLVVQ